MKMYSAHSLVRLGVTKFVKIFTKILEGEIMYKCRNGYIINGKEEFAQWKKSHR